jgi:exosortase E/protease (VPEID-CTERM system)
VNHDTPAATTIPKRRLGLGARLALLGVVFIAEKLILGQFVDSERAQAAGGIGGIVRLAQHWGFRFLVAFLATLAVFAYVRTGRRIQSFSATVRVTPIRVQWILAHALLLALLVPLSYLLYRDEAAALPIAAMATLWIVLAAAAATAATLAMAPWPLWWTGARALGIVWVYAAIAALLGTGTWQLSERLWEPAAALTFDLVKRLLGPVLPTLSADAVTRVLSTDRFAVEVTSVCSGLEGVGLMLTFTVAWLLYFRREYIFPRSLLLIPAGMLAIFGLNALRIAALMLIGHAGFPDIAAYGFHSQAGWIAFNTAACGLVFLSRRSRWMFRNAEAQVPLAATDNPTAAYLMPLLAILAAGVVSRAMSSHFEALYPLRLIAGATMLWVYRRKLMTLNWHWSWRGLAVGVLVFLIWIVAARFLLPVAAMPGPLTAMPPLMRGLWIATRVAATALTVPIAEELAYRGYLLRRLSSPDFESVPFRRVGWPALLVTAIVFGLAHGTLWLPGIAAGLAFGLVLARRGSIGEAVAAHVTANALLAASVVGFGQWQLW